MESQLVVSVYSEVGTVPVRALAEWWTDIEQWAKRLQMPITDLEGALVASEANATSKGEYEHTGDRVRLSRAIESGTARAMLLQSMPSRQSYRMTDWRFMAHYGEGFGTGAMCMVGIDTAWLDADATCAALEFVGEAIQRSRRYIAGDSGFAVVMPRYSMPAGYVLGIAGELPKEMVWDCTAWRRFAGKECGHTIRNVCGYNILNGKHLDIDVGGVRLEDWIETGGGRRGRIKRLEGDLREDGSLEGQSLDGGISKGGSPLGGTIEDRPPAGGLFLWTFQEGEDQEKFLWWEYPPVVAVREELKRFKIFPWQRLSGIE